MAPKTFITAVALAALTAAPAIADEGQHHRDNGQSRDRSSDTRQAPAPRQNAAPRQNERAVTRSNPAPQQQAPRQFQQQRQNQQPPVQNRQLQNRQFQDRQFQGQRQNDVQRQYQAPREAPRQFEQQRNFATPRQFESGRSFDDRRFDNRAFDGRRFGSARIIRPSIIEVAPYRFYSYRPSFRIGVYYGLDGYYPYGYTPPEYFQIVPGRVYGGVRITGAPRDAQVFADGYFVGIVDDFDGIFQHMNLEAGPHHIEVQEAGMAPIAFDVDVRPGQTTTFRADMYRPY